MEAYEFRAYEVCGYWTIIGIRVWNRDDGQVERDLMYRGDHVPIDEGDPIIRCVLLLTQVERDLNESLGPLGQSPFHSVPS